MTPLEWVMAEDTGTSSMTILHVMEGTPPPAYGVDVPHDGGDFGRCYRLLKAFPHYRERLPEMSARYPMWVGLVREWDKLATMYEEKHPGLYETMQPLIDEGRLAAGWGS